MVVLIQQQQTIMLLQMWMMAHVHTEFLDVQILLLVITTLQRLLMTAHVLMLWLDMIVQEPV